MMLFCDSVFAKRRVPRRYLLSSSRDTTLARPSKRNIWRWCVRLLSILVLLGVGAALNEASASSQSAAHHPMEQDNSGQLELRSMASDSESEISGSTAGIKKIPAWLLNTQVNMSINGMVNSVTYVQSFHNPTDSVMEGIYTFPLPENAAVYAMEFRVGERIVRGEIAEKAVAKKRYQQAKRDGKRASLVEQQRPNMFTQKLANIPPHTSVSVTLQYRQTVDYQQGMFAVRLPLTFTPRYSPGAPLAKKSTLSDDVSSHSLQPQSDTISSEHMSAQGESTQPSVSAALVNGWALPTRQVPDAHLISPPMVSASQLRPLSVHSLHSSSSVPHALSRRKEPSHTVTLSVELQAGLPLADVSSPYHDITVTKQQAVHRIQFSRGPELMDRDFVLQWQPVASQQPTAALFTEQVEGEEYALLMVLPPELEQAKTLPRDVIFIVDSSGSMSGSSMPQAKQSVRLALNTLSANDTFNIIDFDSTYRRFSHHSLLATSKAIRDAHQFVDTLSADGGTEMYAPLEAALMTPADEDRLKQVIFITDGSVGNEAALFALIHQQLGDARLFTVGIGSAPNSYFMRKAAEFGRGTFTHVGQLSEVSNVMTGLFRQLESPMLRDVVVEWPQGIQADTFPEQIPDVYQGQPLLIAAKLERDQKGSRVGANKVVHLRGKTPAATWHQPLRLTGGNNEGNSEENSEGIASLWARQKISALMDKKIKGADEADIKPKIVSVALTHQLLSAYTSFIAVDHTPVESPIHENKGGVKKHIIPNLVANGQKLQSHTYPQGSLGLIGLWLSGVVALLMSLVAMVLRNPRTILRFIGMKYGDQAKTTG